jgi:hypothetical protein
VTRASALVSNSTTRSDQSKQASKQLQRP